MGGDLNLSELLSSYYYMIYLTCFRGSLVSGKSPLLKIQGGDSSNGSRVIVGNFFDFGYGRGC